MHRVVIDSADGEMVVMTMMMLPWIVACIDLSNGWQLDRISRPLAVQFIIYKHGMK